MWSQMCIGLHVKYPLFFYDFYESWIFFTSLSKKNILKYQSSKKILPVGVDLFHEDRRTYMTELKVAFRSSANAPKTTKTFVSLRTHICKQLLQQHT